jgi:sodium-dependent phosphate transporter
MSATESLAQASRQLLAGATETKQFEWMVVCGGFLAFFAAFGIGK